MLPVRQPAAALCLLTSFRWTSTRLCVCFLTLILPVSITSEETPVYYIYIYKSINMSIYCISFFFCKKPFWATNVWMQCIMGLLNKMWGDETICTQRYECRKWNKTFLVYAACFPSSCVQARREEIEGRCRAMPTRDFTLHVSLKPHPRKHKWPTNAAEL